MQLDNEIGKVALATPILICKTKETPSWSTDNCLLLTCACVRVCVAKALEMFMQNLVDVACVRTRNVGASKLEAVHLYVPKRLCMHASN